MESCEPPPTQILGDDQQQHHLIVGDPNLPKHISLKLEGTGLYLRYIDTPGSYLSQLEFSGDNNISPKSKFELVQSTVDRHLIHIKSCYNNKYWECPVWNGHITATASKPVEDVTDKVACTLFQAFYYDPVKKNLSLRHVSQTRFVKAEPSGEHQNLLTLWGGTGDRLTVIDWNTIVILPKRLVFKGQNGMYLKAYSTGGYDYMAFLSEKNNSELEANEITQTPDGAVSIRNEHFNKFWRFNPDTKKPWIYADGDSAETFGFNFKPVLLETNTKIALQSLQNKKFCTFSPTDDSTCCLIASSQVINENSHMTIEEPVVSRVIDNVKFRLMDARRLDDEASAFADSDHILNTTDRPKTKFTKVITLTETNSSTWDNISSVKLGISTTLNTGIPIFVKGEIEISAEIGKSYKWGGVDKEETEIGGKLTASVPPKSKLTVTLTYTKGTCEVPFSYVQHDTLTNGVLETTEMDGGIYTGTNCYNFKFETIETPLTPAV